MVVCVCGVHCKASTHYISKALYYYYTTTILRPSGFCLGLPRWAGTRNIKLDFSEARDSGISWAICKQIWTPQTPNHTSTPPLILQARGPSCYPTNSVKALKSKSLKAPHYFLQKIYCFKSESPTQPRHAVFSHLISHISKLTKATDIDNQSDV